MLVPRVCAVLSSRHEIVDIDDVYGIDRVSFKICHRQQVPVYESDVATEAQSGQNLSDAQHRKAESLLVSDPITQMKRVVI